MTTTIEQPIPATPEKTAGTGRGYSFSKRPARSINVRGRTVRVGERNYYLISKDNPNFCNLTELNAADQVMWKGYETHPDYQGHMRRYGYTFKYLMHHRTTVKTHFDVGCGMMQLPFYLWRNKTAIGADYAYWGTDLRAQESWLDQTAGIEFRWKAPVNLVRADLTRDDYSIIPEFPGQFDLVTCFETFEHVPRDMQQAFMDRLFAYTKPGGVCFFSTPNGGSTVTTADNHIAEEGASDAGQSRERTYEEKLEIARNSGFVIEDSFGTFFGTSRAPAEFKEREKNDPIIRQMKKMLSYATYVSTVCAAYPEISNNAMFRLRRPLADAVAPHDVATHTHEDELEDAGRGEDV